MHTFFMDREGISVLYFDQHVCVSPSDKPHIPNMMSAGISRLDSFQVSNMTTSNFCLVLQNLSIFCLVLL